MPGRFWCNSRLPMIRTGEDSDTLSDMAAGLRPRDNRRARTDARAADWCETASCPGESGVDNAFRNPFGDEIGREPDAFNIRSRRRSRLPNVSGPAAAITVNTAMKEMLTVMRPSYSTPADP